MEDIKAGVINLIGDPETRYREDPVRMLRAVRFSTKLRMQIAERTEAPIFELAHLLRNIPPARLFDESLKLFLAGKAKTITAHCVNTVYSAISSLWLIKY